MDLSHVWSRKFGKNLHHGDFDILQKLGRDSVAEILTSWCVLNLCECCTRYIQGIACASIESVSITLRLYVLACSYLGIATTFWPFGMGDLV